MSGEQTDDIERTADEGIEYGIDDRPPLGESTVLGIQHYLTMIGANIAVPLILADAMGMPGDITAQFVGTFFVVSGIATLAQTTFGNRYPIVQGAPFSMLAPALAIVAVVTTGGVAGQPDWQAALLQLQGAIIVAAAVQVLMGYFGLVGKLQRFLSPVVIAPTIALIGLSLFDAGQITSPDQSWWLLGLTLVLIVLFSQYLDLKHKAFRLYPVILAIAIAWLLAAVMSWMDLLVGDHPGYVPLGEVTDASLLLPIYPFQWGVPEFTTAFIIGMFAGVLASIVESIGDYYAVANLTGSAAPSERRINHGIGMEGLMNIFSGIMGTGGSTSYSENVGAIGLTGVASRYVVQIGALVMLVAGFVGYFGQVIATIPDPIVGGLFIAMFAQIVAVGIGNLRHVDLDSSRNVFVIGFALFVGLAIPEYMANFENTLVFRDAVGIEATLAPLLGMELIAGTALAGWLEATALAVVDTVFIIGSTGMAIGGLAALFLDNTIPGTREERGLAQWDRLTEDDSEFEPFWERWADSDDTPSETTRES
ncbi:uracil-xanthine permease family protein [Natronobacterium gregoryi]|uniref:Xanthine permease n=2 Tax=Natronobacterium gregoryi TaxID=44930 RepID=L0AF81_NATGS|nr:solute carrier family 23 protein [Natronobacterium gregoryi]AFZ71792.1 xanthine/uracil permease [Natronobacterium gregoryi SP2]ELY72823.1 xanthine/uracil/vitamin C permease [Natronobacterium gregoryi SP2]PLK21028.1 xanthine permease [Natronobacterium gregoryi SP2]SFI87713.1 Xanthine/uracil permease [Natronobacterium gregoryi]